MSNTLDAQQPILCGMPGDLVRGEPITHQHDKIGGLPRFPGGSISPYKPPQCGACNGSNDMHLIAQVFAPRAASTACPDALPDRVIHVYGCCRPGCGKHPNSWAAYCCMGGGSGATNPPARGADGTTPSTTRTQEPSPETPHGAAGDGQRTSTGGAVADEAAVVQRAAHDWGVAAAHDWGAPAAAAHDWGAPAAAAHDWGVPSQSTQSTTVNHAVNIAGHSDNNGNNNKEDDGDDDIAALSKALQGMSYTSTKHPSTQINTGQLPSHTTTTASPAAHTHPTLPEFYILFEPQPQKHKKQASSQYAQHAQHVAQLVAQYGQVSGEEEGGSGGGGEGWGQEGYEEDSARGVDAAFLKFTKRLALVPQQCIRYCSDPAAPILWPVAQCPDVGSCTRCGAPRAIEVQLMAPLIHCIHEAVEWVQEEQPGQHVSAPPESWEWLTVAVATCAAGCVREGGGSVGWAEELIMLQNE